MKRILHLRDTYRFFFCIFLLLYHLFYVGTLTYAELKPKFDFKFSPVFQAKVDSQSQIEEWLKSKNNIHYSGVKKSTKTSLSRLMPAGDTYFMRYPGMLNEYIESSSSLTKQFQLARLVNNFTTMKQQLVQIATNMNNDRLLRYRANTGIARAALRANHIDEALQYAKYATSMYVEKQMSCPWLSDAYYLMACAYIRSERLKAGITYLRKSLELDESFLEAHWLLVQTLAEDFIISHFQDQDTILERLDILLKSLESITDLTQNRKDFHQLAKNLHKYSTSIYISFATGYCYMHAGDFHNAENHFFSLVAISPNNLSTSLIIEKSTALLKYIDNLPLKENQ